MLCVLDGEGVELVLEGSGVFEELGGGGGGSLVVVGGGGGGVSVVW